MSESSLKARIARQQCARHGHQWVGGARSEFIVTVRVCKMCRVSERLAPWGMCATGHPMIDHFRAGVGVLQPALLRWGVCGQPS